MILRLDNDLTRKRNTFFPKDLLAFAESGRRKRCGLRTLRALSLDGSREKFQRVECKAWSCSYCGPRKARVTRTSIIRVAEEFGLTRFVTLTLDPSKIRRGENPVRYLRRTFDKFRAVMHRRYGSAPAFVTVLEFHKSGMPHLHVLIDRFIERAWLENSWGAIGGGFVKIKFVDVHRIARYLGKYLTKELLLSAPEKSRRITTSRSVRLNPRRKSQLHWTFERRSIFFIARALESFITDRTHDEHGFLCGIEILAGAETPPWMNRTLQEATR